MGSDISANYDNIVPIFIAGFWKVHSAISRLTQEPVSLWLLDNQALADKCKGRNDRENYIQSCIHSMQQMRRMRHPQILRIHEMTDNPKQLAFSAEHVDCCLLNETNLQPDEIEYIADQMALVMNFLHNNARTAHLGISPTAICLTKSLSVKLCGFNFSTPITGELNRVFPKYGDWSSSVACPLLDFSAPEITMNKTPTNSCDVFSFGVLIAGCYIKKQLFACATPYEMGRLVNGGVSFSPAGCSAGMTKLIKMCLSPSPEARPTFDIIMKSEALSSLQLKVYRYLDVILTKQQAEKFNFFKSMISSLKIFSPRMLRFKFMPLLMSETLRENRFGPVTIPLIFQIASMYDRREFTSAVLNPLGSLLLMTRPPEMCLAVFSVMKILFDRVEPERHYEVIWPIFQAAMGSDDPRLQAMAIKYAPVLMTTLNSTTIKNALLPKLADIMINTTDLDTVCSCISCTSGCLTKVDHDAFAEMVFPKVQIAWRKLPSPQLATSIAELIEKINATLSMTMKAVVPLISEVVAVSNVDPPTQLKLARLAQSSFQRIITDRRLEEKTADWKEPHKDELADEIATLAQEQQKRMVAPKPKPKPAPKADPPEPARAKRAAPQVPRKKPGFTPPPEIEPLDEPEEDSEEKAFWGGAQNQEYEDVDAAIVNGILDREVTRAGALRQPTTAEDFQRKYAKKTVVRHT